jgi:hypothetical protein
MNRVFWREMELHFVGNTVNGIFVSIKGKYRGADKSLARPERKQVTATEDFDFHISYL